MSKGIGWFGESHRHALSARGVKTGQGYYAKRSSSQIGVPFAPQTRLERLRTGKKLEEEKEAAIRSRREGQKLLRSAEKGELASVAAKVQQVKVPRTGIARILGPKKEIVIQGANPQEQAAIRAQANIQAVQFAEAGIFDQFPENLKPLLSADTKARIDAEQKLQRYSRSSAATKTAIAVGEGAVVGAEESLRESVAAAAEKANRSEAEVLQEQAAEQTAERRARAVLNGPEVEKFSDVNPFFKGGVPLFGDEQDGLDNVFLGRNEGEGVLTGLARVEPKKIEPLPPLSDSLLSGVRSDGLKFAKLPNGQAKLPKEAKYDERVKKEVDALYGARKELGHVDIRPFEEAKKAYREGNREKLIKALNEEEFQVQQQNSRWKLADQTRSLVESQENREGALDDEGVWSFFSGSGNKLADQTKKIHEVRRDIKTGYDTAQQRAIIMRKMLEKMNVAPREQLPYQERIPKKVEAVSALQTEVFGVGGQEKSSLGWKKAWDTALPDKPVSKSHDFGILPKGVRMLAPKKRIVVEVPKGE